MIGHNFSYFAIREHIATDIRRGLVASTPDAIADRIEGCAALDRLEAVEFTERFLRDLKRGLGI